MISEPALQRFRTSLRGQLLLPGEPGYEDARKIHNAMIDGDRALLSAAPGLPMSSPPSDSRVTTRSPCQSAARVTM